MNLSYKELLAAQLLFGTKEEDIIKRDDFNMVLPNVLIAPWWEVEMFNNCNLKITKINEKLFNLVSDEVQFSFIQVKQIGAPAIIEEVLNLGLTKCKHLIFIGSVGSLLEHINIGDIVIPRISICGDGASRYLNTDLKDDFGKKMSADDKLNNILLTISKNETHSTNVETHFATNFSIDTIFGQFPHIDKIKSMGAETIEMETYSLFKASKIAGINAAALLCVSDNAITNKSLYSGRTDDDRKKRKMVINEIIPKIVIEYFKSI